MYINPKAVLIGAVTAAGTDAKFTFYSGTQPNPGESPSGISLADVIVPGVLGWITDAGTKWTLTINPATPDSEITVDGLCSWARLSDSASVWVADFTVTALGGGGDIVLRPNNNIYVGGTVSLSSALISVNK